MNISQIRHFLKLVESLNFTAAARASGVTQPTLTRSIQRLEEQLGGRLLYRDGKDTRLTSLGMAVRDEFEAILRSEERIQGIARENRAQHQPPTNSTRGSLLRADRGSRLNAD